MVFVFECVLVVYIVVYVFECVEWRKIALVPKSEMLPTTIQNEDCEGEACVQAPLPQDCQYMSIPLSSFANSVPAVGISQAYSDTQCRKGRWGTEYCMSTTYVLNGTETGMKCSA